MEKEINKKIIEIVHQANNMIPVVWDDLYIVIEVDETYSGEVFFYFKYMDEYYYSLNMPRDFEVSQNIVFEQIDILFNLSQELKKIFNVNNLPNWFSCVLHINQENKLSVDFDYTPWYESDFGPIARMDFFEYKYLGKQPENEKELEQFKAMEAFQQEHNRK